MPDGYALYAASPADFVAAGQTGTTLTVAAATLTVWNAATGGTQVTDLLNASEAPVTAVATDSFGNFRFYAPTGMGTLWVTAGTPTRYAIQPADLGSTVEAMGDAVTQAAQAAAAAPTDAEVAATVAAAVAPALRVPSGTGRTVYFVNPAAGESLPTTGVVDGSIAIVG